MRQMKDSGVKWIGEIPADWDIRRLKNLPDPTIENSYVDGDWIESPDISNEGIRYLTTGNIGDGEYKEQGNGYITEETFSRLNCKYAYPGDLVISRLNSPYGRSCLLPDDFPCYVLAVDNVILRPTEEKRYICYVTQCDGYHDSVADQAKGTTMKRISRTNLGNIIVPIPSRPIQNRISDYLDSKCSQIDSVIAKQEAIIERLKEYKLSVITEAVTKGLDPNVEMKDSGISTIGAIPFGWRICKLFYLSEKIGDGLHGSPEFDDNGDCYFVNGNNLGKDTIDIKLDTKTTDDIEYQKYKKDLNDRTLLISLNGTIGNVSKYNGEKIILGKSAGFVKLIKDEINIDFLKYYLQSRVVRNIFNLSFSGTTINNLSLETLRNLPVLLMDDCEQIEIVDYLDNRINAIDESIKNRNMVIRQLHDFKKSLIYEVVTGKKEV